MGRSVVTLRTAERRDASVLAELWTESLRRADHDDQIADLEGIIDDCASSSTDRIVVAEHDGELAGAVLLRITTVSALNLDPVVQALAPHVFAPFRRRGIGRLLMESAVAFAEESGVPLVATAAFSGSREANRFMARLSLGPSAIMRIAPAAAVRAKLTAQRPTPLTSGTGQGRQLTRVLAARRSMRRSQPST